MTEITKTPGYMAQLLDALGWNQGTRIPLANEANQELENQLIKRQNELQQLKETLLAQNQKQKDLDKYKAHVLTENQENVRLLVAHKQQMEQEVKLQQLALYEVDNLERDTTEYLKQSKDITNRIERLQQSVARQLKKADDLKTEVCGERGALQEWRTAIERNACDIEAMEQFTKIDTSKAKALEIKRQKLKLEHDRMHERLLHLVSNLSAEERACDRISIQVTDGMEERKKMMVTWTSAVENLRQRDKDIKHIREDYKLLEVEANAIAEKCREQDTFCEQQRGNNAEIERENGVLAQQLSKARMEYARLTDLNMTLESEMLSLRRELSSIKSMVEKLHIEAKFIQTEQARKELALQQCNIKLAELKEKLVESRDTTVSSEKRAKELEMLLNDEERYANQLNTSQQRSMHCSFVEQQKLLALQNEEKLLKMQQKASTAIMSKLDSKQKQIEKDIQAQKESLYAICYQVETFGAKVSHMEGWQVERDSNAELLEKENRLRKVQDIQAARMALLERHSARLTDDMRRLTRDLELKANLTVSLQGRLKSAVLNVEGGVKDLKQLREAWRHMRVEEALMRLRVTHAARALAGIDDKAFSLREQRLNIDTAMNERTVEINSRREMFNIQKRALIEDCGKLRSEIREREQRIEQLIKRYDIFIASIGKDESGKQVSVTYFKIKFAAERAQLRERGAALDRDIGRCERDVSALEATLRVVHHAHAHFLHHITPLKQDTPEIEELNKLTQTYYEMRGQLKLLNAQIKELQQAVDDAASRLTLHNDKNKQLSARRSEVEIELDGARERMQRQESRLQNSREIVKSKTRRAKKLIEGSESWRTFQVAIWCRDYAESSQMALSALQDLCREVPQVFARFASLIATTDLQRFIEPRNRTLRNVIEKIVTNKEVQKTIKLEQEESIEGIFSTSSESSITGESVASGYTKRLSGFRRHVAPILDEPALVDDFAEQGMPTAVGLASATFISCS